MTKSPPHIINPILRHATTLEETSSLKKAIPEALSKTVVVSLCGFTNFVNRKFHKAPPVAKLTTATEVALFLA